MIGLNSIPVCLSGRLNQIMIIDMSFTKLAKVNVRLVTYQLKTIESLEIMAMLKEIHAII